MRTFAPSTEKKNKKNAMTQVDIKIQAQNMSFHPRTVSVMLQQATFEEATNERGDFFFPFVGPQMMKRD